MFHLAEVSYSNWIAQSLVLVCFCAYSTIRFCFAIALKKNHLAIQNISNCENNVMFYAKILINGLWFTRCKFLHEKVVRLSCIFRLQFLSVCWSNWLLFLYSILSVCDTILRWHPTVMAVPTPSAKLSPCALLLLRICIWLWLWTFFALSEHMWTACW